MLIDSTYFRNDIKLTIGTYSDIDQYILQYEKEVLIGLLGYTLYTEMMAAYEALPGTPLPEKWNRLINGYTYEYNGITIRWNGLINTDKVSFIGYYVYCQYLNAKQSQPSGAGVVTPKNENSTVVDGVANHAAAWNKFVAEYYSCWQYLFQYETYFVDFFRYTKRYEFTNSFGI
jgi:hypothetical protein